jgi:chromosome segregation ATPase
VRLSTRNALLETKETELHQAQQELVQLKQRQQVLLELFGEKEEQVEELQAEVGELKAFYRKQLDTLAGQQR